MPNGHPQDSWRDSGLATSGLIKAINVALVGMTRILIAPNIGAFVLIDLRNKATDGVIDKLTIARDAAPRLDQLSISRLRGTVAKRR